jgi:hypothetical protein
MNGFSRRDVLKNLALGTSAVGFSQLFGISTLAAQTEEPVTTPDPSQGDSAETILNLAATAEALACTHYYTALTDSQIPLTPDQRTYLVAALDAELSHLLFLNANGAQTLTQSFYFPLNVYRNIEIFADITQQAETSFVAAYLAANRRLAELGESLLAATVAQIATTESVHLALVRQLGGLLPNHVTLGEGLYYNVSEVSPVLRPFLEGGVGFASAIGFPGEEAIRSFIGDSGIMVIEPFTQRASANNS